MFTKNLKEETKYTQTHKVLLKQLLLESRMANKIQ